MEIYLTAILSMQENLPSTAFFQIRPQEIMMYMYLDDSITKPNRADNVRIRLVQGLRSLPGDF
jgi:hypothetical protein